PPRPPSPTLFPYTTLFRSQVQKELEDVRQSGRIGSPLQAEVAIVAPADDYEALASLGDDLRFVLITSAATVQSGTALAISVTPRDRKSTRLNSSHVSISYA